MNTELKKLHIEVEAVRREAAELLHGLDDTALNQSSGKGIWSVGQQFDHLCRIGEKCLPPVRAALSELRTQNKMDSRDTFPYSRMERFFISMMNPSGLMRLLPVPVPSPYEPTSAPLSLATLAADFDRLQETFLAVLQEADGLDLLAAKVPSPANAKVTLTVGAWLQALATHERYHLSKAQALCLNGKE